MYNNFINNVFPTFDTDVLYGNKSHQSLADAMFDNVVATVPQKRGRDLRVVEYKDFRAVETKANGFGCWWRLEYIPTGEVLSGETEVAYRIGWFVWWYYNHN